MSYSELADLELELNDAASAARHYDQAIELLKRMTLPEKDGRDYNQSLLSLTLCSRAKAALEAGDLEIAADRLDDTLLPQELLVQSSDGNAFHRWALACVYVALAELRIKEKRAADAVIYYKKAMYLGWKLHAGDPTRKPYALVLDQSMQVEETLARDRGDAPGADKVHRQRCDLAAPFVLADGEDVRFQRSSCP
jgi:tetratricopeptide (TPR) repeat protein